MFTQILRMIWSYCQEENVHSFLVLVHFNVKNKPRKMCILRHDVTPMLNIVFMHILHVDIFVIIHLSLYMHCSLYYDDEKFTFNKDERECEWSLCMAMETTTWKVKIKYINFLTLFWGDYVTNSFHIILGNFFWK